MSGGGGTSGCHDGEASGTCDEATSVHGLASCVRFRRQARPVCPVGWGCQAEPFGRYVVRVGEPVQFGDAADRSEAVFEPRQCGRGAAQGGSDLFQGEAGGGAGQSQHDAVVAGLGGLPDGGHGSGAAGGCVHGWLRSPHGWLQRDGFVAESASGLRKSRHVFFRRRGCDGLEMSSDQVTGRSR